MFLDRELLGRATALADMLASVAPDAALPIDATLPSDASGARVQPGAPFPPAAPLPPSAPLPPAAASTSAVGALSTSQLLSSIALLGELTRLTDSLGVVFTAEVNHRVGFDAEFRREALGGDVGGRLASELFRDVAALDDDDVRNWERVAAAIAPRRTLQGELLPCRHEPLAQAVLAGTMSARAAAIIASGIDRVADFADAADIEQAEHALIELARSLTTRQLTRLVREIADRFDVDGAEPREEHLRERASVTVRQRPDGLTRIIADLHPEAAGFFLTALDARTAPRRLPRFVNADTGPDDVIVGDLSEPNLFDARPFATSPFATSPFATNSTDPTAELRSLSQRRADALADMARESLAADPGSVAGTAVTMLVTVSLDALTSGMGTASVAGIDEPICAGTARRLAASAELIPVVLGTRSEPLDVGRSLRLFTEAQRRALAVRDGGCIWPGCDAPPAWCEVAHLDPWILGGPTNLDNGALMCSAHHHRFDRDGWALRRDDGIPYLIPPPWLDATRTPRRAGRISLAAA